MGAGEDEPYKPLDLILGPEADPLDGHPSPPAGAPAQAGGTAGAAAGPGGADDQVGEERRWKGGVGRAWLAPLLVGSVSEELPRAARRHLERWLQFVRAETGSRAESDMRLSLEVALAQGFKYAANRRRRHPHAHPEARAYLAERAKEMLKDSHFWFSRLTLLHALCLWSLPDGPGPQSRDRRDIDHQALVRHWLGFGRGGPQHALVAEAGKLSLLAPQTGKTQRFISIDENGAAAPIGSRSTETDAPPQSEPWD